MNWLSYIPTDHDVQASRSADFEACASYSAVHIAEMVLKRQNCLIGELSERYLAKTSDTQPWGNTLQNVVDALNLNGVCLTQYWPELTYSTDYENIDWATYYTDIPASVLNSAYRVNASFTKLSASQVEESLNIAPVWAIVKTSSGQLHCVAQINDTQFFDSYEITVKNFSDGYPIQSQYQLTIKPINMPNAIFAHNLSAKNADGTPNPNEFGFFYPKTSQDSCKDGALNSGLNILNPDGSIDFGLAKQMTLQ